MATASPTTLPTISVETDFTDVVTITFDTPATGNIISVSADLESSSVILSNTLTTVIITGRYGSGIFDNKSIKHITRGSSDRLEQYEVALNFSELVSTRQVFDFSPDPRNSITVTYTIKTNEGDLVVEKTIENDYSSDRDSLREFI